MKKLIPLLLSVAMILTLAACAGKKDDIGFSDQTRKAVTDFVTLYGKNSPNYQENSYVVSDFDNTTPTKRSSISLNTWHLPWMRMNWRRHLLWGWI